MYCFEYKNIFVYYYYYYYYYYNFIIPLGTK